MPSHPDRVRQNYCEHDWIIIQGITVADYIKLAYFCVKCKLIGKSWMPGIEEQPNA